MLTTSWSKCEQSYKLLNGLLHLQPIHYLSVQHDCWPGSSNFKVRRHSNNFLVPQYYNKTVNTFLGVFVSISINNQSMHYSFDSLLLAVTVSTICSPNILVDVITFNNFSEVLLFVLTHYITPSFTKVRNTFTLLIMVYKHEVESAIYLSRYLCLSIMHYQLL